MQLLVAQAGPDTGLPRLLEVLIAIAFYAGPVLFAGLAIRGFRRRSRGRLAIGLALLASSVYTEAAFLDLACSPGDEGCAWLDRSLWISAVAGLFGVAGLLAVWADRAKLAVATVPPTLILGLFVTVGYLARAA